MQLSQRTLPLAHILRRMSAAMPLPGWDRVFRKAFDPAKQTEFQFEIPLFEGTFVGHANNWVDWCALFHGCYERDDILRMRALLSDRHYPVVLDIGANVGHHSVALAGMAVRLHAFEPYPPRLAALRANTTRNPHLSITVHPLALGLDDGEATFRLPVTGEWAGVQFDPNGALRFPIRNGDNYLREQGIDRVDLIKLDVDGNELDILGGLESHIERCRPVVVVEANEGFEPLMPFFRNYRFTKGDGMNVFCLPN